MYYLSVGDNFTIPSLIANDHLGEVDVNVYSNNLNINNIGTYEILYVATNDVGSSYYTITIHVEDEVELSSYYASAEGLSGNSLFNALRTISNTSVISTSYDKAKEILEISDRDPNNPNNVLLIYNRASVQGPWSDGGVIWNREHVWPQSFLNGSQSSDPHNIRPANPGINSSRGNDKFAPGSGSYAKVSGGFYPGDEDKGDVARIMFYMITRYNDLTITTLGNLEMFIEWHLADPVDDFERTRNEVLYSYTHNRNPYIDYPHFVNLIWGEANISSNFVNEYNLIVNYLDAYVSLIDNNLYYNENELRI